MRIVYEVTDKRREGRRVERADKREIRELRRNKEAQRRAAFSF